MPELPEVETTRRGIAPHVVGERVVEVVVRDARLRWPVDPTLASDLRGQKIVALSRRGKYLLFRAERGTLVMHLGMSGSLRVLAGGGGCDPSPPESPGGGGGCDPSPPKSPGGGGGCDPSPPKSPGGGGGCDPSPPKSPGGGGGCDPSPPISAPRKHDHLDLVFGIGKVLRFHDPRRFGCALWTKGDPGELPLIAHLGVEPFSELFHGKHLHEQARRRTGPVKSLIMDASVVVGVGNIYANESLFEAGIHPHRAANRINEHRFERLAEVIRSVLARAIEAGGTTLRDYLNSDGEPGYFVQQLSVYERSGEPCRTCGSKIKLSRKGQRATYYCPRCQT